VAGIACVAAVAACDLGTVTVASTASTLVIHGVLNPSANDQVILVERTLTGAIDIPDSQHFDFAEPILSAGGVPVSGATVELIDSLGRVTRGVEDRTVATNGKGAGVYRVPLRGGSIIQGSRYQLRVRTNTGEELTAFTRVPRPPIRQTGQLTRTLNRDRDAVFAQWTRVPDARSYAVRIESPFGPFFLFTDSTTIRLSGDLRNLFAGDLQRVFIPGFRQDMIIAAVDSNFYDYYRTNNDPFTGAGIISRVKGGLGLFGSIVSITTGTISVTADQTKPIEGRFRLTPTSLDPNTPTLLTLYIESDAARPDLATAVSGRFSTGQSTTRIEGLLGRIFENEVTLTLIANQLAGDTIDVWDGELVGDTLRGTYRKAGVGAVFVRVP
jgi:hypothetical protein